MAKLDHLFCILLVYFKLHFRNDWLITYDEGVVTLNFTKNTVLLVVSLFAFWI